MASAKQKKYRAIFAKCTKKCRCVRGSVSKCLKACWRPHKKKSR